MFGQSVGFNYSQDEEQFTSLISGCISFLLKIFLVVILYLRFSAIVNRDDTLFGKFDTIIDPVNVNEVSVEQEGFLMFF